ncbi:hypothetical protein CCP3SC1AL1_290002 [Gammaproteobacteria bacterium]
MGNDRGQRARWGGSTHPTRGVQPLRAFVISAWEQATVWD